MAKLAPSPLLVSGLKLPLKSPLKSPRPFATCGGYGISRARIRPASSPGWCKQQAGPPFTYTRSSIPPSRATSRPSRATRSGPWPPAPGASPTRGRSGATSSPPAPTRWLRVGGRRLRDGLPRAFPKLQRACAPGESRLWPPPSSIVRVGRGTSEGRSGRG